MTGTYVLFRLYPRHRASSTDNTLKDEQFALFATANTALVHIVIGLNDMYKTVRDLVGEKDLHGLDRASERWATGAYDV